MSDTNIVVENAGLAGAREEASRKLASVVNVRIERLAAPVGDMGLETTAEERMWAKQHAPELLRDIDRLAALLAAEKERAGALLADALQWKAMYLAAAKRYETAEARAEQAEAALAHEVSVVQELGIRFREAQVALAASEAARELLLMELGRIPDPVVAAAAGAPVNTLSAMTNAEPREFVDPALTQGANP